MAKIGLKETVLAMGFLGALVVPAIILGEKDRKTEEKRRSALEEKTSHDEYLEYIGLEDGQTIRLVYVPSLMGEKRVVFNKEGNPIGYHVYNNHDREFISYSEDSRLIDAYHKSLKLNGQVRDDSGSIFKVRFNKEDLEALNKVYRELKTK